MKPFLEDADREKFVVVCLDTKNQPTAILPYREFECEPKVFQSAILANAASVFVAPNHSSTDPTPSSDEGII
ncbi:JAB domain-containing protein [Anoxybacteroides amylolyticum]|uniref:JAB domain-containing protein n=1 Tax=Anoxybacteroides amylolyticum TaxID=294699 RepID=UPI00082B285E|nr:JAB domain-containing protein [Anoxybacillus amylolyticus]